jgi:hypothetical protein
MDSQFAQLKAQQSVAAIKSAHVGSWTIKFGKYTGKTYEEVKKDDHGYLKYMMDKGAFNDEKYAQTNTKIKEYILA